jgi:ATP-binding cassette subfamily B protein
MNGRQEAVIHYSLLSPFISKDVLCGLNLEVESGEVLAVTGKSGAGKSTIFLLLSRMYDATEGAISLDGVDITQLSPVWLRRNIGVVDQEPTLFEGSIAENIRWVATWVQRG